MNKKYVELIKKMDIDEVLEILDGFTYEELITFNKMVGAYRGRRGKK